MEKITCYVGPIEPLLTYLYDPASKSKIIFNARWEIIDIEYMKNFPKQAIEDSEAIFKKEAKEVKINKEELNALYIAFKNAQKSDETVIKLSKSLLSKLD